MAALLDAASRLSSASASEAACATRALLLRLYSLEYAAFAARHAEHLHPLMEWL